MDQGSPEIDYKKFGELSEELSIMMCSVKKENPSLEGGTGEENSQESDSTWNEDQSQEPSFSDHSLTQVSCTSSTGGDDLDTPLTEGETQTAAPLKKKRVDTRKFNELKCTFSNCDKVFHRPDRLSNHLLIHFNLRQHACQEPGCFKSYTQSQHLRRHMQTFHSTKNPEDMFPCSIDGCLKIFQTKAGLVKHFHNGHMSPKHTCEKCGAVFPTTQEYHIHLIGVHNTKVLTCDKCDLVFTTPYAKKRHDRRHRIYTCEEQGCNGVVFDNYKAKRKHNQVAHPTIFYCNDCAFSTQRRMFIEEHVVTHLSMYERPVYKCTFDNCDKSFLQRRNYMYHYRNKHCGESESKFKCDICERSFAFRTSYSRHMKAIHENPNFDFNKLKFLCGVINCTKRFETEIKLQKHFKRMHSPQTTRSISHMLSGLYQPQSTYPAERIKSLNNQGPNNEDGIDSPQPSLENISKSPES